MVGEEWPGLLCSRACSPLPRGWVCRSPMATGPYDVTGKTLSLPGPPSLGEDGIRSGARREEGKVRDQKARVKFIDPQMQSKPHKTNLALVCWKVIL